MRVLAAELHGSSLDMEKTGNTDNEQNVREIKVIGWQIGRNQELKEKTN